MCRAKVKVAGTFHVPFTRNAGNPFAVNGTWERASDFCRLFPYCTRFDPRANRLRVPDFPAILS